MFAKSSGAGKFALALAAACFLHLPATSATAQDACEDGLTIERGDTLAKVARRCGMQLSTLLKANPQLDNPNIVEPGTRLNMPDPMIVAAQEQGTVQAQPGDTLITIADRLDMPLAYIMAANPEIDPDALEPGMQVAMPLEE